MLCPSFEIPLRGCWAGVMGQSKGWGEVAWGDGREFRWSRAIAQVWGWIWGPHGADPAGSGAADSPDSLLTSPFLLSISSPEL